MDREGTELIGNGLWFEEFELGRKLRTKKRTITEADLGSYINLTWFTEELFAATSGTFSRSIEGRVVPANMVMAFSEGLVCPTLEFTGQALLELAMKIKAPTRVGDTIFTLVEVIEARLESKGVRGLVRTRNRVFRDNDILVVEYDALRMVARKPLDA